MKLASSPAELAWPGLAWPEFHFIILFHVFDPQGAGVVCCGSDSCSVAVLPPDNPNRYGHPINLVGPPLQGMCKLTYIPGRIQYGKKEI